MGLPPPVLLAINLASSCPSLTTETSPSYMM
eukprot:CAMPEP_0115556576 /NCGR_PEP_ID=MMETSP0271-20121206/98443_1 /TAXON_ID=71861 /ORGANISM="Scrippsiella trochoidea, Strain CCMP3099" /LENGTH=30 /DNA_ID= /DNA_START= /DNA_END= /DNA_ORIENTATION=